MTDDEIYKGWFEVFKDRRYLRPVRWQEIKTAIKSFNVKTVLEFGCGISTLLFENMGLKVYSYETDEDYLKKVKALSTRGTSFYLWDNKTEPKLGNYDLGLVDGDLPRDLQLKLCKEHTKILAIDDFAGSIKNRFSPKLADYTRIDLAKNFMAIFTRKKVH